MSVKLGSTAINGLYLGSTAINAAYLGATQIFGGGASGISLVGSAEATGTTVSIPAHSSGDLIFVSAHNTATTSMPTLSGYTAIAQASSGASYASTFYQISDGTPTSVTVTGAQYVIVAVYTSGGTLSIGASGTAGSSSSSPSVPALTLQTTDGSSWVVATATFDGMDSAITPITAPSSMTERQIQQYQSKDWGTLCDTAAGVASWSGDNWTCEFATVARVAVEIKTT